MESTFIESLARLLNIRIVGGKNYRTFRKVPPPQGPIRELEGGLIYFGVCTESLEIWKGDSEYLLRYRCGDTTLEEHKGIYGTSIACFKDFFENPELPLEDEIEIFNITHPWVFPAINTLIEVVSLHGGEDVITE